MPYESEVEEDDLEQTHEDTGQHTLLPRYYLEDDGSARMHPMLRYPSYNNSFDNGSAHVQHLMPLYHQRQGTRGVLYHTSDQIQQNQYPNTYIEKQIDTGSTQSGEYLMPQYHCEQNPRRSRTDNGSTQRGEI